MYMIKSSILWGGSAGSTNWFSSIVFEITDTKSKWSLLEQIKDSKLLNIWTLGICIYDVISCRGQFEKLNNRGRKRSIACLHTPHCRIILTNTHIPTYTRTCISHATSCIYFVHWDFTQEFPMSSQLN